jgi:hypothetical protein
VVREDGGSNSPSYPISRSTPDAAGLRPQPRPAAWRRCKFCDQIQARSASKRFRAGPRKSRGLNPCLPCDPWSYLVALSPPLACAAGLSSEGLSAARWRSALVAVSAPSASSCSQKTTARPVAREPCGGPAVPALYRLPSVRYLVRVGAARHPFLRRFVTVAKQPRFVPAAHRRQRELQSRGPAQYSVV